MACSSLWESGRNFSGSEIGEIIEDCQIAMPIHKANIAKMKYLNCSMKGENFKAKNFSIFGRFVSSMSCPYYMSPAICWFYLFSSSCCSCNSSWGFFFRQQILNFENFVSTTIRTAGKNKITSKKLTGIRIAA